MLHQQLKSTKSWAMVHVLCWPSRKGRDKGSVTEFLYHADGRAVVDVGREMVGARSCSKERARTRSCNKTRDAAPSRCKALALQCILTPQSHYQATSYLVHLTCNCTSIARTAHSSATPRCQEHEVRPAAASISRFLAKAPN